MDQRRPTPRLWEGMLDLYSEPGVAAACLDVQDSCEADVLMLLTAALLAHEGLLLTPALAGHLSAETDHWRQEVILPLRGLRRRWRGFHRVASLRERVGEIELDAERKQVERLQALLDATSPPLWPGDAGELLRINCDAVMPCPGASGEKALMSFRRCVADAWRPEKGA